MNTLDAIHGKESGRKWHELRRWLDQEAAEQSFAPDSPYFCGECGTRANLPHHPRCSHFQSGGG